MSANQSQALSALPRMACSALPDADYTESEFHFTITHTVWLGGASLCFCDTAARAELIARAFNGWLKTDDGQTWAKSIIPQNSEARNAPPESKQ